jgi:cytoskeletal protein RodZ
VTVGEKLKRERKKQKLTLEYISEKTKIGTMFLIALEEDDMGSLPGGIYSRNFLRAYASCLGLDEDLLTSEYHEQNLTKPTSVLHQEQTSIDNKTFVSERKKGYLLIGIFTMGAIALVILAVFTYDTWASSLHLPAGAVYHFNQPGAIAKSPIKDDVSARPVFDKAGTQEVPPPSKMEPTSVTLQTEQDPSSAERPPTDLLDSSLEEHNPEEDNSSPQTDSEPTQTITVKPLLDMSTIDVANPLEDPAHSLTIKDLFFVYADREVWLEVSIDGVQITRRLLKQGEYRAYKYGTVNQITCGDFTRVTLQDGPELVSVSHMRSGIRETLEFERYKLGSKVNFVRKTVLED